MSRIAGTPSWTIHETTHPALDFAAYIGLREGFTPEAAHPPRSAAEEAWRTWWAVTPPRLVAGEQRWLALRDSRPDAPFAEHAALLDPAMVGYNPPDFESRAAWPALQTLCRSAWPTFIQEQRCARPPTNRELMRYSKAHNAIRCDKIVKDCAHAVGRTPHPFTLWLHRVRWHDRYVRLVADTYLVVDARYWDADHHSEFRAILHPIIARLV